MIEITVKIDDRGRIWHNGMMYVSEAEIYSGHQNKHPENEEHRPHKREFGCDTCAWYENGQCTHVNKNAYYPCLDWLRRNRIVEEY